MTGYYPNGQRTPSDGFIPSGSLIKAILVHSTKPLEKIVSDDGTIEDTTLGDFNQGFGRVQLNKALSFGVNGTLNGLTLFVKGAASKTSKHYVEIASKSTSHTYTFRTVDSDNLAPIRVTLTYTVSFIFIFFLFFKTIFKLLIIKIILFRIIILQVVQQLYY